MGNSKNVVVEKGKEIKQNLDVDDVIEARLVTGCLIGDFLRTLLVPRKHWEKYIQISNQIGYLE
jgi:hypothetical protein